jgi:DNA polymerase-3 subunit epsilon
MAWPDGPLLGLDFETTGVDPTSDLPVQFALVLSMRGGARRVLSSLVDPGRDVPAGATAVHGISTEMAKGGMAIPEAAQVLHGWLRRAAACCIPVVAMNASFDLTIAECLFRRACLPPLRFELVLDPLVMDRHLDGFRPGKRRLENLCAEYGVQLGRAHDAACDATAAVSLVRALAMRWAAVGGLDPALLTLRQASWHRTWAENFDLWCRTQGRAGLEDCDFSWPIRLPRRAPRRRPTHLVPGKALGAAERLRRAVQVAPPVLPGFFTP